MVVLIVPSFEGGRGLGGLEVIFFAVSLGHVLPLEPALFRILPQPGLTVSVLVAVVAHVALVVSALPPFVKELSTQGILFAAVVDTEAPGVGSGAG